MELVGQKGDFFLILPLMKFFHLLWALCVVMFLVGCEVPFAKDDPVIVSVGDTKLRASEVHKKVPEWDSWTDREKLAFLERWIEEETIFQEAQKAGVDRDPMLSMQIEQTARKMVVDRFMQSFDDTMVVGDAEKIDYYNAHKDLYLRGTTLISGAQIYFKDWTSADAYYKGHKNEVYDSLPKEHYLIKKIETFDSVAIRPDTCLVPEFSAITVGKLSPMKLCSGALKMFVVTQKLDSADVLPYEEVVETVSTQAWLEHRKMVRDRLKKEWKNSRPIFSQTNVFSGKDK